MEDEHLHLLINEEIYSIPGDSLQVATLSDTVSKNESVDEHSEEKEDLVETKTVDNQEPLTEANNQGSIENEKSEDKDQELKEETKEESALDSPMIPSKQSETEKELSFAVFHSSTNDSDIELLNKIISACKLPENEYQIFAGGFDQNIKFKKALVFVPEAKAFYIPIPYKNSEFLCSKPLDHISGDVQEKTKLWNALQKFVDTLEK